MEIIKIIKGNDGKLRKWFFDSEKRLLLCSAYAGDFSKDNVNFIIKQNNQSAQELIDEIENE